MIKQAWTTAQTARLRELGLDPGEAPPSFTTASQRDRQFQIMEKRRVKELRQDLDTLLFRTCKTRMQQLREDLETALLDQGFVGVSTPLIINRRALEKMTINRDHPLSKQVFWLNDRQCLRPMLAPNLYSLMQDLSRTPKRPVRFFEIGSCFRKESGGARHANEFTMLNLVEMGLDEDDRSRRLEFLATTVLAAAGIKGYRFEQEDSQVYGTTIDVVTGKDSLEVASGAMGPHPLDGPWGITDTWVGMGFGLERLAMAAAGDAAIGRWAKSLAYMDGIPLSI